MGAASARSSAADFVIPPELRAAPAAFKTVPVGEVSSVGRWGGGGVLAGIGGAIASAFGALFGRKKDKNARLDK